VNKNLAETGNPEEQKKEAPQVRSASCPIGYNPLLGEEASQAVCEDRNDHDRNDITHPDKPKAGGFMRQRTAVVDFVLGVVFHNPTHENGGTECCDHKADVAAHKVERIENVAIENAYVAPRTIGKNARQIAEQEDAAKRQIDGAAQADAQTFNKHADDHLIDGQRRRQSSNHQQQEEDDRKEVAEEHFGECDRKT
jgi:hypothetical protein